jgi:hypothetical protein
MIGSLGKTNLFAALHERIRNPGAGLSRNRVPARGRVFLLFGPF